ncbi:hypothetical protein [Variovorax sp. tm]
MTLRAVIQRHAATVRQAVVDASLMVFVGFLALLAWAWRLT